MHVDKFLRVHDPSRRCARAHRVFPHHQKNHGCNEAEHRFVAFHVNKLTAVYPALQDALQQGRARRNHFFLIKLSDFRKVDEKEQM